MSRVTVTMPWVWSKTQVQVSLSLCSKSQNVSKDFNQNHQEPWDHKCVLWCLPCQLNSTQCSDVSHTKGNKIKQKSVKLIPMHHSCDLNHLKIYNIPQQGCVRNQCYHLLYLHYLSVALSDRYKHTRRAGINQHVIFTLVTALFRDPWQSQYFLWGFPFDTPRTPWLISWLNKCVMLRQATHLLQPSSSYVNACAEYDGGFTFQYKSPPAL